MREGEWKRERMKRKEEQSKDLDLVFKEFNVIC